MNVLITGAKGQLGSQIIRILKNGKSELGYIDSAFENAEIIGIDIEELDITSLSETRDVIRKEKPHVVINAAAYTNVDGCEDEQDIAFSVNAIGARNIAIACEEVGAKLVHISTDYVFDGSGKVPHREYENPNPKSVYGKSKWLGEEYVKQFCTRSVIMRTSWIYGYQGKNFVKTMLKLGRERDQIKVVNDQRGNPTNAEDLAHHILKVALTDEYGIYHCTGEGECSWYEFACEIMKVWNIACKVKPCTSEEFPQKAKRPVYSSLENSMLKITVGNDMREWKVALKAFKNNYRGEIGGEV